VGFSAFAAKQGQSSGELVVEVVPMRIGSQPLLNSPVVLTPEGKVATPGEGENKSFLQKYWWAIALFFILQVVIGGGGKE